MKVRFGIFFYKQINFKGMLRFYLFSFMNYKNCSLFNQNISDLFGQLKKYYEELFIEDILIFLVCDFDFEFL